MNVVFLLFTDSSCGSGAFVLDERAGAALVTVVFLRPLYRHPMQALSTRYVLPPM